ncbi:Glycosyltransferase, GT2 family [Corynebacterium appendicis CIP 107643]|uniref:Glycosyltransferase, GT2 family n=1 Tax=Corynebacterium appendicis CIP 107643 TaxID=1161099 RepID=A0A1N7JPU5_9CORY|nr:glycosyltransferase [Corynebacterium appendicis]WJY61710.1 Chondroitin synthase [Corynebacterium appendicis CIP 107643]SIS51359.1 Glycosyltransferase, GT2 family [Corynebacterium appendicis CIP 107643]
MISVVIPHYNAPEHLARVVEAVRAQDVADEVEIIVADDGSDHVPHVPDATVVTQDDLGFRAAAARNLGASHARGEILAFLDGDTVPEPGYLAAAARHVAADSRAVVVGTRLTGPSRTEPQWLIDAWSTTHHLSTPDDTSWRFIISSVLTCSREFFERIGGFDGSFIGYGGEDWEFGFRAWNAGATFVHEPAAVAVHDEDDFGGRFPDPAEEARVKNVETTALAHRITHPIARPSGVRFDTTDISVCLNHHAAFASPGVLELVVSTWLALDATIYLSSALEIPDLFRADPRVRLFPATGYSPISDHRITVNVDGAFLVSDAERFHRALRETKDGLFFEFSSPSSTSSTLAIRSHRSRILRSRPRTLDGSDSSLASVGISRVDGPVRLERRFAGW